MEVAPTDESIGIEINWHELGWGFPKPTNISNANTTGCGELSTHNVTLQPH
jgi:hypothetical protein